MTNYHNPVNVIKTNNWLRELQKKQEELNIFSPLLVTTPGNRLRLSLDSHFPAGSIFDNFGANPDFDQCNNALAFCREKSFDGVIAIGGGSAMDLAKVVIAYLCLEIKDIFQIIAFKENYPKKMPSIFLPTTHGTASEVTMWGTIWNMKEKKKYSISNENLYPSVAILDGNLTRTLPLDISIVTVMDALSHSFESIWNKNTNPISIDYAIEAISLILKNVEMLKHDQNCLKTRNKLLDAANKAGLAFSNTKTAAAHSISYPLTIHYGIPHGVASSISIIPLLKINGKLIKNSLDKIFAVNSLTYEQLLEKIESIPKGIISYKLNKWAIPETKLDQIASESFTKGRMDNNLVDLSINDVKQILNQIY